MSGKFKEEKLNMSSLSRYTANLKQISFLVGQDLKIANLYQGLAFSIRSHALHVGLPVFLAL